jgi:uncharacterized protein (UPF0332 family)
VLDPEQIGLSDLALALEDHSPDHTWWFEPQTGGVSPRFVNGIEAPGADVEGLIEIQPLPTEVGYADMEDFVAQVRDPRARALLERAITGRGAFRRFKDTLLDYPELRRAWFAFHDARGEQRAIRWLVEHELIAPPVARRVMPREPTAADLPGLLDADGVVHRVSRDLRRLYRDRLRRVLLVGGWARGDAHPESEIELLVVLDTVADRWREKTRMDKVMWRHSIRHDTVLVATPISEPDFERGSEPVVTGTPRGAPLNRAHEEIRAARALLAAGFPSQALSRAYLAGFHAAGAALVAVDQLPATRTGVVSTFGRQIVAERGFDHEIGRVVRRLFEDRNDVDFGFAEASAEVASGAIHAAERLLAATEAWLAER